MGRTARRRAKQYSTFAGPKGKATGAQFKAYVDTDAGLKRAWAGIQNPKTAQDRKNKEYWELRGATSKEAFGRAHAAEDEALRSGKYPQGDTKRTVGSKEWKEKYADGTTRFEDYLRGGDSRGGGGGGGGGDSGGGGGGGPDGGILGPYPEQNIYFPMLDTAYTAPNAQDWSAYMPAGSPFTGGAQARYPQAVFPPEWGTDTPYANSSNPLFNQGPPPEPAGGMPYYDIPGLLYQPWSTEYQQAFVPGNLWNYVPPELNVGAPQYSSGGHISVSGGGGGGGGGGPPGKKPPWWETDPQDGAEQPGGIGNLGKETSDWNEKWTTFGNNNPVRRGWALDDDGKWRTFADIARDEAAKADKTAEAEAEAEAAVQASIADML